MRILVCAYSCRPHCGSEPGSGWEFVRLAATEHDVWVLTATENRDPIETAGALGLASARFHYLDAPVFSTPRPSFPFSEQIYYFAWQWGVRRVATELHRRVGFDLIHHVTFAADWAPVGVFAVKGVPAIWGPVGGSTKMPWSQWRWIGGRGLAKEAGRDLLTSCLRAAFGRAAARRADITLAQNDDSRATLARWSRRIETFPNTIAEPDTVRPDTVRPDTTESDVGLRLPSHLADRAAAGGAYRQALFVARLIPWKGWRLAIAALAEPAAHGWRLDVLGDGPEAEAARRLAIRLGVASRVRFRGYVDRTSVWAAMDRADALLAPSLHEACGHAVAEAIARGCPVVCVDRGGPSLLVDDTCGIRVPLSDQLPADLATALANVGPRRPPSARWSRDRARRQLARVYAEIVPPTAAAAVASALGTDGR